MKIFLDTVGCRLNRAEIEAIGRDFRAAGHEIVPVAGMADMAVVNTCAVTAQAASDSRAVVRRTARSGVADITVTGCWATLQEEQAAALPNVKRVVENKRKQGLVAEVLHLPRQAFDLEPLARQPLPGLRQRTRAFIKVQDGCDNHCTFCVTTVARGPSVSRRAGAVLADINAAVEGGAQEVVLTGVHLGSWGRDFGMHLWDLVRTVLEDTDAARVRLSSLEPWDLDAEFFSLWQEPRLCQHLHLPLQSGCAATLKRMARNTTPDSYRRLVAAAREAMPEVAITTDVIAGFPGESDAEFAESLEYVEQIGFAGGHAFTYSPRPGTGAARLPDQVAPSVRKERNARYRAAFERSAHAYRRRFLGQRLAVLWESTTQVDDNGWQMEGLTGNYLRVTAAAPQPLWNQVSPVLLRSVDGDQLAGVILG